MILKFDNGEHIQWSKCCDECKDQPYRCFICDNIMRGRGKNNHMSELLNNRNLYVTSCSCKVYTYISYFRFQLQNCWSWFYLQRCKFRHTKDKFREHAVKFNIDLTHVDGKSAMCLKAKALAKTSSAVNDEITGLMSTQKLRP